MKRLCVCVALLTTMGGAACGPGYEEFVEPGEIGQRDEALYGHDDRELWPGGLVPVCWDASSVARADFGARSAEIRGWVEETWQAAANVNFYGWNTCPDSPRGTIRIFINDSGSASANVGYLAHRATHVNLGVWPTGPGMRAWCTNSGTRSASTMSSTGPTAPIREAIRPA